MFEESGSEQGPTMAAPKDEGSRLAASLLMDLVLKTRESQVPTENIAHLACGTTAISGCFFLVAEKVARAS